MHVLLRQVFARNVVFVEKQPVQTRWRSRTVRNTTDKHHILDRTRKSIQTHSKFKGSNVLPEERFASSLRISKAAKRNMGSRSPVSTSTRVG